MIFIIGYCVLGGGIVFGLLFWLYQRKVKRNSLTSKSFLSVVPPMIESINCFLAGGLMALYLLNPASAKKQFAIWQKSSDYNRALSIKATNNQYYQ